MASWLTALTSSRLGEADPERLPRRLAVSLVFGVLATVAAMVIIAHYEANASVERLGGMLVSALALLLVLLALARAFADQGELRRLLHAQRRAQQALELRIADSSRALQQVTSERLTAVVAEAEQREFSEALREVVLAVAGSEDLRTALQAVVAAVRRCGPISASGVMFVEDGIATTVCHDGYVERGLGPWVEGLVVPVDRHPSFSLMYHQGETVVQNHAQDLAEWRYYAEVSWVGSYLGVPLRVHGRTYGFINVVAEQPGAFTAVHAERLTAIARSVALALENARLLARARRRLERLGLLIEVGNGLNRQVDATEALNEALWRFGQATECGVLMVCGGDDPAGWRALAAYGIELQPDAWTLPVAALMGSGVLAHGWSLIREPVDDLRLADPALQPLRDIAATHGRRLLIAVPLTIHDHCHGVLLAFTQRVLGSSESEQLRLLGAIIAARIEVDARLQAERQARASAEEASRLKGEFLANTSHELRTPLTGILLGLELATDGSTSDEAERAELLSTAHQSAARLLSTINGLLDLAKIEAGRLEVHPQRLDVTEAVAEVVTALRPAAERRGLYLTVPGWTVGDACPAWADPAALHQILTNLIGNALKFTENGGVVVSLAARDGRVVISVADTGLGISPDQLSRLFQPFVQADGSSTRRFEGSGLGLVIARRMAEQMGGSLTLRSDGAGRGCVAEIELPAA